MVRKKLAILVIITIFVSTLMVFNENMSAASTSDPVTLKLYLGPTSVPADNNAYNCVFVQLQDASGKPARAKEDTLITLSSSATSAGKVDDKVTIPKTETYASANFYATFTPGKTNIAASATGFQTVQATITTVGPIPAQIALYGLPPILPSDGGTYGAVMVELQDASGYPAKAPEGGVTVVLSCSNPAIGSITSPVTIEKDQTYVIANFTTTTTPGTTDITPVVTGYNVKNKLTITSQTIGLLGSGQPRLQAYTAPVQADKTTHKPIAILLQNNAGNIIAAASDLTVYMGSSAPEIGTTQAVATVSTGQVYTTAHFTTTFKAGVTTITAASDGFISAARQITTCGFIPTKLAVYSAPPTLPSDKEIYSNIQVQLQDSQGRPAKAPEIPVYINMSSSDPTIGTLSQALTIPVGGTQATELFTATNSPGTTTITAQASGYNAGSAKVTTYVIDYSTFEITIAATPSTISSKNTAEITAHITSGGTPVTSVQVTLSSDNGGSFSVISEQGNGDYKATFTAPSFSKMTTCTITANAAKTGYITAQGTVQINVQPPSSTPTTTPSPSSSPSSTPTANPTSSPTIPSTGDSANLELCIKDVNGNPLNGTIVTSIDQPSGVNPLFDIANDNGHVSFRNVTAGSYIFALVKQGYEPMNASLSLTNQPMALTITLLSGNEQFANANTLITVALIVIIIVVASVVGVFFVVKRKSNVKERKLRELQQQLKQKY